MICFVIIVCVEVFLVEWDWMCGRKNWISSIQDVSQISSVIVLKVFMLIRNVVELMIEVSVKVIMFIIFEVIFVIVCVVCICFCVMWFVKLLLKNVIEWFMVQ